MALLAFGWMCLIFSFSARPAEESAEDSHRIGYLAGTIIYSDFEDWSVAEKETFAEKVDHPIRKTAHATEYAILGILICLTGITWIHSKKTGDNHLFTGSKVWLISWFLTTIYAATDEFHQLFVPGRSGQISDVVLDSFGAAIGVLLVLLVKLIKDIRNNK